MRQSFDPSNIVISFEFSNAVILVRQSFDLSNVEIPVCWPFEFSNVVIPMCQPFNPFQCSDSSDSSVSSFGASDVTF